jgi:hypothetical protein
MENATEALANEEFKTISSAVGCAARAFAREIMTSSRLWISPRRPIWKALMS